MSTLLADNAYGTLAVGLATGDTALTFTSGHGARFPTVAAPDVLYCCILNTSNILEEVIITAHASGADTATITRAAGSTVAKVWVIGDRIEARLSSTSLNSLIKSVVNATFIPAGSRTVWNQTSAPTGWTKDTTAGLDDTALRIVIGTVGSGGSVAFSTSLVNATVTGAHTLSTAEIPSHSHRQIVTSSGGSQLQMGSGATNGNEVYDNTYNVEATGGGGSHTHPLTLGVKYNDVIIASKDA